MVFAVNDSPLQGSEGTLVTSNAVKERLKKEGETNVSLKIRETDSKDQMEVQARGELQLGVLLETMRREGFELSVSPPRVVFKMDDGAEFKYENNTTIAKKLLERLLEPVEEVIIDVDAEYSGGIIDKMNR